MLDGLACALLPPEDLGVSATVPADFGARDAVADVDERRDGVNVAAHRVGVDFPLLLLRVPDPEGLRLEDAAGLEPDLPPVERRCDDIVKSGTCENRAT